MSSLGPSIEDLPGNVMADVLSRLPVKKIIHCKCVCKNWRQLVSDSYFVKRHLSRSPPGFMIVHKLEREMYYDSDEDMSSPKEPGILKWVEIRGERDNLHLHRDLDMSFNLNLTPTFRNSKVRQVGSVDGLLCLWQYLNNNDNTYICNPITREYMILPRQKYYKKGPADVVYGFGVGLLTKAYKVIRIFQGDKPPKPASSRPRLLEAEVYTLGTGEWRHLGHVPYWLEKFHGPFLNGCVHWIVRDEELPEKLCAFDIDNETFQLFPSRPCEETYPIRLQSLGVLNGFLSQCDTSDWEFTIWVMKEYGAKRSWHKEVVIRQNIRDARDWWMNGHMSLIEGLKDGTIFMLFEDDGFLVYLPQKKSIEEKPLIKPFFTGIAYRPSFLKLLTFDSVNVHMLESSRRLRGGSSRVAGRITPSNIVISGRNYKIYLNMISSSIEDLPGNVIADVLSRLPVKKIIHCKCVCKNWRDLVSGSYFVNRHLSRSPPGIMIVHNLEPEMCYDSEEEMSCPKEPGILKWVEIQGERDNLHLHRDLDMSFNLNLTPTFRNSKVRQVGSVDGLLCLWQYLNNNDNTYICNPITREYIILPRQNCYKKGPADIVYGFGVGLLTNAYKVIRIFQGDKPQKPSSSRPCLSEAEIYTLGTGKWRHLGHVPYWLKKFHGPFLNGCVHWIVLDEDSPEKLCAFDIDNETFQLFPSPPCEEMGRINFQSLGVLNGFLSQSDTSDWVFTIWVMKEYGVKKSWLKEVVIRQNIFDARDWWMNGHVFLLEGLNDGTIFMLFEDDGLLVYLPQKKSIEEKSLIKPFFTGIAYRPSFLKLLTFDSESVHVLESSQRLRGGMSRVAGRRTPSIITSERDNNM